MNRNLDVGLKFAVLLTIGASALFTSRGSSAGPADGKVPMAGLVTMLSNWKWQQPKRKSKKA